MHRTDHATCCFRQAVKVIAHLRDSFTDCTPERGHNCFPILSFADISFMLLPLAVCIMHYSLELCLHGTKYNVYYRNFNQTLKIHWEQKQPRKPKTHFLIN